MTKLANILVYEWEAWKGFLISHLIADYCRVPADYSDGPDELARSLTPNIKAVLFQVNLSRQGLYPGKREAIIQFLKQNDIIVLNEHARDISKSALHKLLDQAGIASLRVSPDDDDTMDVMVKSELNWGGEVEQRLPADIRHKMYGQQKRTITASDQYYVTRKKELPGDWWQDSSIVVERYIPSADDSFYRVYRFGDSVVVVKAHSPDIIKKISGDSRDVNFFYDKHDLLAGKANLPENLQSVIGRFMTASKIDYFCLDIVHNSMSNDDEFYIVDLNVTPYSGVQSQENQAIEFLCHGAKADLMRRC